MAYTVAVNFSFFFTLCKRCDQIFTEKSNFFRQINAFTAFTKEVTKELISRKIERDRVS